MASTRSLSEKISGARKRQKIKQESLAGLLGCTRSYISKLESGRIIPSAAFAEKLERALSLRPRTLVSIVGTIRVTEIALKRQAIEHARAGAFHNRDGCVYCDGHKHAKTNGAHRKDGFHRDGFHKDGFHKDGASRNHGKTPSRKRASPKQK